MTIPRFNPTPARAVLVATVATGVAIGARLFYHPGFALAAATIAAAAVLSVLRHLVNQERPR
ncbi:MAG: hypothetical protein M3Y22_08990 [Pseudomonadota bacterium]|nr:hypothetical protein [Pseudomonadota bacterium]